LVDHRVVDSSADVEVLLKGQVDDNLKLFQGGLFSEFRDGFGDDPQSEGDAVCHFSGEERVEVLEIFFVGIAGDEDAVVAGGEEMGKRLNVVK
jgi:hypothetical protein